MKPLPGAVIDMKSHAQKTFTWLDNLSRQRALTEEESVQLARAIKTIDGGCVRWTEDMETRFFDAIADGMSIGAAGRLVGVSKGAASGKFTRAREAMRAQGV